MNDQVLVSEMDGGTDRAEELQPFLDGQITLPAELRERHAIDILHHEEWPPIFGDAGVQQPGDVRVIELARDRALAAAFYDSGSSVGGAIAPFLILPLYLRWGWRVAFAVPGLLGFLWLIVWRWLYQPPPIGLINNALASFGIAAQPCASIAAAISAASSGGTPGRVLICGSLYLAGRVLAENG